MVTNDNNEWPSVAGSRFVTLTRLATSHLSLFTITFAVTIEFFITTTSNKQNGYITSRLRKHLMSYATTGNIGT